MIIAWTKPETDPNQIYLRLKQENNNVSIVLCDNRGKEINKPFVATFFESYKMGNKMVLYLARDVNSLGGKISIKNECIEVVE